MKTDGNQNRQWVRVALLGDTSGWRRRCSFRALSVTETMEINPSLYIWRYRDSRAQFFSFYSHPCLIFLCAKYGQDCIYIFTSGPTTLRKYVNISKIFHEERGQKDTKI